MVVDEGRGLPMSLFWIRLKRRIRPSVLFRFSRNFSQRQPIVKLISGLVVWVVSVKAV